jgi:ABC-type polysaccharide/polyol phosphate transport system ATPase subunit
MPPRVVAPTGLPESQLPESQLPESQLIVRLEGVGKSFRRFEVPPFLLRNMLLRLAGRAHRPKEFWPLREISFAISRGETVGILGHNGSGKSTLLRLIAGAAYPTKGHIAVRGRIAPLLALGAGFHPDMTGRECVEINATALGLSPAELARRFASIVAFAELPDFIDTPIRYYSSGMQARLGFSVAVHTEPDLLLVDEVLAVGDHAFQVKCMQRIDELRAQGTTILFVSHDAEQVRRLCDRVLWLKDGRLVYDGPVAEALARYEQEA